MATMDSISAHHVYNLVIFVRSRAESTASCRDIVEEIFHRNLGAVSARYWAWVWSLARLGRDELASAVDGSPGTGGIFGLGGDSEVGDVTDTCQSLSTEAIGGNGGQVLKLLQLGRCEALTQNRQVFLLYSTVSTCGLCYTISY